jgi:DNA-directed RNA polymerase specialized sigma24 family protein
VAQYEPPIGDFWDHSVTVWHPSEPTPMGALMSTLPCHDPVDSILDRQPLREAVAACMEQLSAEDRYILDAWHIEQITIRAIAQRMGLHKSYTYRLVKRAEARLRDRCMVHPTIQTYLGIAGAIPPQAMAAEAICDGVA